MTPVRGSTSRIQHKASSSSKSRSSRQHVPSEDSEDHMEVGRKEETHPRRKISIAGAGEGRRRKSRRIARTHGIDPGPSGWRRFGSSSDGDDDGVDERDLIPPSDDEEYEAWKAMRKQKSSRRARSEASEVGAEVSSQRQRPSEVDAVNVSTASMTEYTCRLMRYSSIEKWTRGKRHLHPKCHPTIPIVPPRQSPSASMTISAEIRRTMADLPGERNGPKKRMMRMTRRCRWKSSTSRRPVMLDEQGGLD